MSKKRAIVVLGVGLDGTSMFAGILHKLGFYLGLDEDLIPPNRQNPKGFYENKYIPQINRLIFDERKQDEYELAELIETTYYTYDIEEFLTPLLEHNRVALKDPRFCVTLPVWARIIEKTHDLTMLVVHRDIEDHTVALRDGGKKTELEARDYINNRRALQRELSQFHNSIEVNFEEFMMYPEDRIRWLVKELKTRCLKAQMEDIMEFIS